MNNNKNSHKFLIYSAICFNFAIALIVGANGAFAQDVGDVVTNIGNSSGTLPGVITGGSYILATIFGALGLVNLRKHVEAPNQTELKIPSIQLLASGAMLTLPTLYDVFQNTINPGAAAFGEQDSNFLTAVGGALAAIPFTVNAIFGNIGTSISTLPGLATGGAYLLGSVAGISAILKLKAHVEAPGQTLLRESVIRALISGALFSVPFIADVVFTTVADDGNVGGLGVGVMGASMLGATSEGGGCITRVFNNSLGGVICRLWGGTVTFPLLLKSFAYIAGIFIAIWGLLKIQDHVLKPDSVPVWEGISRLLVAGGLFALPTMLVVIYNTVSLIILPHTNSAFGADVGAGGTGLDAMLSNLVNDIFIPMSALLNWFGLVAGGILIFIGITRLMKSAQEGARGPGGIGTIMTFIVGGLLISFSPMITAISSTLFINPITAVQSDLVYEAGLTAPEIARVEAVVDSIIRFVFVLGLISIMRGFFIMRKIAEGDSQASMMASVTHMVGGGIAVNLGPMINAMNTTLGITNIGLTVG